MSAHVAVVIPTRNRPSDLAECLRSLQHQTQVPDVAVVCDSSDGEETRLVCESASRAENGIALRYRRAASRGAAVQRNLALELVPDEIDYVLLADDDVVFHADYVRLLMEVFSADRGRAIAGVAGVGLRLGEGSEAPSWFLRYARLFLLGSTLARGRVLPSGVNVAPPFEGGCVETDWLFGCAMYRRSVFAGLRFAEDLAGYSLYDDVDFSMRARAVGRLVVCPKARLTHRLSATGRPDPSSAAAMEVTHRYWLIRRHMPSPANRLAYWWSILGLLILQVARALALRPNSVARLRGILRGMGGVIEARGRFVGEGSGDERVRFDSRERGRGGH